LSGIRRHYGEAPLERWVRRVASADFEKENDVVTQQWPDKDDSEVLRYIADKNEPPLPVWPNPESRDAARYRWLRDTAYHATAGPNGKTVWCVTGEGCSTEEPIYGEALDAAIDATMKTPNRRR
jgi:hypothetical protein